MLTYRLNNYALLAFTGADQPVRLYMYGDQNDGPDDTYFGYIDFTDKITQRFVLHENGIINAFMPSANLGAMLDLLRHESPVYFVLNEAYNWAGLKTGKEPVGEEEEGV